MPHKQKQKQTHANTRVPSTPQNATVPDPLTPLQRSPHLQKAAPIKGPDKPHIILPDKPVPPPRTPPFYIPTPKGWQQVQLHGDIKPHVIPPEPLQVNHLVTLQCASMQGKYA
eukprot:10001112-Ditylum_brightwellii.AAC.1